MTKVLLRKQLGSLVPVDALAEEALRKVANGELVQVEVKRPRNLHHHRKLFALLSLIFENQERFQSVEEMLDAIKVYIGHCQTMQLRDGTVVKTPRSIAFHRMDQNSFEAFYNKVLDVVAEKIIPGISKAGLRKEVEAFLS